MGNLQVRFLEGWAPAMAPGYSTLTGLWKGCQSSGRNPQAPNEAVLRWEADATHQVGKTRVGPQRVPEWFHFKVAETTGALPISLFEPREGLILLTEPGIDNSERKGRRIPLLRGRLKLFEHAESLTSLTQPRMRVPQKSKGHGPASAECRVLFQLRQTLSMHSSGDIHLCPARFFSGRFEHFCHAAIGCRRHCETIYGNASSSAK